MLFKLELGLSDPAVGNMLLGLGLGKPPQVQPGLLEVALLGLGPDEADPAKKVASLGLDLSGSNPVESDILLGLGRALKRPMSR